MQLAFELHTHAEIESVRLRKSRVVSRPLIEPLRSPIALRLTHRSRQAPAPEGLLRLEIDFHVSGTEGKAPSAGDSGSANEPLMLAECTWEVDYRLAEGYQPDRRTVKAFKDGNAVFNCWPYFREYVQSTVTRMNLPPLTLPLLRLSPKPARRRPARTGERAEQ